MRSRPTSRPPRYGRGSPQPFYEKGGFRDTVVRRGQLYRPRRPRDDNGVEAFIIRHNMTRSSCASAATLAFKSSARTRSCCPRARAARPRSQCSSARRK